MPSKDESRVTDEPIETTERISVAYLRTIEEFRPLSDGEFVEALLRFANTGSAAARALLQASVRLADSVLARYGDGLPEGVHQPGQLELREALAVIAGDAVSAQLAASWRRRAAGLVLRPTFEADGARRFRFLAFERYEHEPQPAIAYALLILFQGPFRERLCRCGWCHRFFLQPEGRRGPAIRAYCPDTDHREHAHQAGAAERMRKSRERAAERDRAKQRKHK